MTMEQALADQLAVECRLRSVTLADVYARLHREVRKAGSQRAFADKIGVSPQFLNAVLTARRSPTPSMLKAVGLKQTVYFEEIRG